MHLFYFLLVIASLSCGSLPPAEVDLVRAAGATLGVVIIWVLLSHLAARMVATHVLDGDVDPLVAADSFDKQMTAFRWGGLAVSVLCLGGFGLARGLDSTPLLRSSMFLQAWILLTPGVAITVGTWSAEHYYGVILSYSEPGVARHLRSLWQSFRSGMAWLVIPVIVLLGISDLIDLLPIPGHIAGWVSATLVVLFVPLGLPWLMRHLFKTQPLDPATGQWVQSLMEAAGLRRTRALRWDTGMQSYNALVAGFVPPIRTLLLSDRLLSQLPREQVSMVVLHEAAHLRRKHVPLRMLTVLPAWLAGVLVTRIASQETWGMAAGSAVGILMTLLILRCVAYRTEIDADVQACRMAEKIAQRVPGVPKTYDLAAETLSAALMRVTFDQPGARKPTWLHPGVAERVESMRRHRAVPAKNMTIDGTIAKPA